jgi:hypothetical protein
LVLTAYICCGLVIASFALFARDQFAGASRHQQDELVAGHDTTAAPVQVKTHHGQPRRFIDGAAAALTSPFRSLAHTDSHWALEIEATVLALLIYGVGLGFLARVARPGD